MLNDLTYEKVVEEAGPNQILVFVHSPQHTMKTAPFIRDKAIQQHMSAQFVKINPDVLRQEAETVKNTELRHLLPFAFGIHHAGMTPSHRLLLQRMFRDGQIQVLIATATLAWHVHLPPHRVIIKGTQVYSAERGQWVQSSNQHVLQILPRPGHPQFDTEGEGILITSHASLHYHLSLLNQQLPIQRHFISPLLSSIL